jgi:hypothetical protein
MRLKSVRALDAVTRCSVRIKVGNNNATDGGRTLRAIVFGAAILAALTATAEAGKRENCAASTGATSGAAFNSCMSAPATAPEKKLYKDPASRGRCRMGNC